MIDVVIRGCERMFEGTSRFGELSYMPLRFSHLHYLYHSSCLFFSPWISMPMASAGEEHSSVCNSRPESSFPAHTVALYLPTSSRHSRRKN